MSADDFFKRLTGNNPPSQAQPGGNQPQPEREPDPSGRAGVVARRMRRMAEQFLDNEALTGDLDDQAANLLIDWGLALSQRIAESTRDLSDELAQARLDERAAAALDLIQAAHDLALQPPGGALPSALRSTMSDPQAQAGQVDWEQLTHLASIAYGEPVVIPPTQKPQAAPGAAVTSAALGAIPDAAQRITGLRRLIESAVPTPSNDELARPHPDIHQGGEPEQGQ